MRPCAGRHSWQFFRAWRSAPEVATRTRQRGFVTARSLRPFTGFALACLSRRFAPGASGTGLNTLPSLADDVQANKASSFRAVGKLLGRRRKKPFAPSVLPAVQDAAGDLCTSPQDTIRRWREHFGALEDGVEASKPEILQLAASSCS